MYIRTLACWSNYWSVKIFQQTNHVTNHGRAYNSTLLCKLIYLGFSVLCFWLARMAVQASAAVGDVCPGPPRVLPINSLESADPNQHTFHISVVMKWISNEIAREIIVWANPNPPIKGSSRSQRSLPISTLISEIRVTGYYYQRFDIRLLIELQRTRDNLYSSSLDRGDAHNK